MGISLYLLVGVGIALTCMSFQLRNRRVNAECRRRLGLPPSPVLAKELLIPILATLVIIWPLVAAWYVSIALSRILVAIADIVATYVFDWM